MSRFPTAAHLASWAGLCPGNHESAGKRPSGRARKGDTALRTAMVEAAWAATRARTTYLGAQYQSFRRRFGRGGETKAIFAVAHTMLGMAWHVLAAQQPYAELGVDYFSRRADPEAHARRLAREIEKLDFDVTIQPHTAPCPDALPHRASAVELTPAYEPGFSCQGDVDVLLRGSLVA